MNNINGEIIQKYIDKELSEKEQETVREHIYACPECKKQLNEQEQIVSFLKENISTKSKQIIIPEFNYPLKSKKKRSIYKKCFYAAAIACCTLLLFFAIYPLKKSVTETEDEYIIIYNMDNEFDSNKPFSEQNISLYLVDGEGNIIEEL